MEGAGDAIERLQVKAEKWTDNMFRERESPSPETDMQGLPRLAPGIETVEEELPKKPVVQRLDSKRDTTENQTSGKATEKKARQSFREKQYPRIVTQLKQILQVENPIDIDWDSLGHDKPVYERLEYDLKMLVRALGQTKHYQDPYKILDAQQIRQGIARVYVRRVERMDQRLLEVKGDTLRLHFYGGRYGSFSSDEIRALLADRQRLQLSRSLNRPEKDLPPMMREVWRNRLPLLYRNLDVAMGQPIPWHIDWESLNSAPDASDRLVYMLDGLVHAVRKVLKKDGGYGMRSSEWQLQREKKRREKLLNSIQLLRVRGGSYATDKTIRFDAGVLELVVFQDEQFLMPSQSGLSSPKIYKSIRRYPPCRKAVLQKTIMDSLNLEVGPYLWQAKEFFLPKTQAYLKEYLATLITKTGYAVPERVELREMLETKVIKLEIDWASLISPSKTEDRLRILRKLETGKYNTNRHYGALFRNLFYAIGEASRQDRDFLKKFLHQVEVVRFEQVSDPESKELFVEGSTLVLRQSLHRPYGEIGYVELATDLLIAMFIMADGGSQAGEGGVESIEVCLSRLRHTFGKAVSLTLDDALAVMPEVTCRRIILPLLGAVRYLEKQPAYKALIQESLKSVRIRHSEPSVPPALTLKSGVLMLSCSPGEGARGCLPGDGMARALDDLLALRTRSKITIIEQQNRTHWQRMLRDRFHRDVAIEVDWGGFLAHPDAGGNKLLAVNVQQAGIERLIYALTRWMDNDERFKSEAVRRINGLFIGSADNAALKVVELQGDLVVYRCFAGDWDGYYTIEELQQYLGSIILEKE